MPAAKVTIIRPELTPEERERRMRGIKKAAEDLVIATMEAKAAKRRQAEREAEERRNEQAV